MFEDLDSEVHMSDFGENISEAYPLSAEALGNTSNWSTVDGVPTDTMAVVVSCLTPIIVVVGLVGNSISLLEFACRRVARVSTSFYLCLLFVADICFLVALSVIWLDRVGVTVFSSVSWVCKVRNLGLTFSGKVIITLLYVGIPFLDLKCVGIHELLPLSYYVFFIKVQCYSVFSCYIFYFVAPCCEVTFKSDRHAHLLSFM